MVILDIKDYIDKADRQLNNYKQLDFDTTVTYWKNKIRNKHIKKQKPVDFENSKLPFRIENTKNRVSPSSENT